MARWKAFETAVLASVQCFSLSITFWGYKAKCVERCWKIEGSTPSPSNFT